MIQPRLYGALILLLVSTVSAHAADAPYRIKETNSPIPVDLKPVLAKLLEAKSIQLLDAKGNLLSEIWMRKEVPAQATPEQIKNGLTYAEVPETTLLGVMQVVQPTTDYRKHKIKPGLYTFRLTVQPMDGDHMGTAPYRDFCLLVPAADEKDGEPLANAKELHEMSSKSTGKSHPAIFLLFPTTKAPAAPQLMSKDNDHWVLNFKAPIKAGNEKGEMGFNLTLIGHTTAE